MTFELLDINLYDLLKQYKFCGLPRERVRRICYQILKALAYIEQNGIIHCDLKPENVLMVWPQPTGGRRGSTDSNSKMDYHDFVKLIDFGSSCLRGESVFSYIQSRFYRAPEVILRLKYDTPIDMWSFGCLLAELVNGLPLFPGEDEPDQMACIMTTKGLPPAQLIDKSSEIKRFFTQFNCDRRNLDPRLLKQVKALGIQLDSGLIYVPKYAPLVYSSTMSPMLKPGRSKSGKLERGIPGSCSLLQSVMKSKVDKFKIQGADNSGAVRAERERFKNTEDNDVLIELLNRCLTYLPDDRVRPSMALEHEWFRSAHEENGIGSTILPPRSANSQTFSIHEPKLVDRAYMADDQMSQNRKKYVSSKLMPFHQNLLPDAPQVNMNGSKNNYPDSPRAQRVIYAEPAVYPEQSQDRPTDRKLILNGQRSIIITHDTSEKNRRIADTIKQRSSAPNWQQSYDPTKHNRSPKISTSDPRNRPISEYHDPNRYNSTVNISSMIQSNPAHASSNGRTYKLPSTEYLGSKVSYPSRSSNSFNQWLVPGQHNPPVNDSSSVPARNIDPQASNRTIYIHPDQSSWPHKGQQKYRTQLTQPTLSSRPIYDRFNLKVAGNNNETLARSVPDIRRATKYASYTRRT